jgi:hypothetical protein
MHGVVPTLVSTQISTRPNWKTSKSTSATCQNIRCNQSTGIRLDLVIIILTTRWDTTESIFAFCPTWFVIHQRVALPTFGTEFARIELGTVTVVIVATSVQCTAGLVGTKRSIAGRANLPCALVPGPADTAVESVHVITLSIARGIVAEILNAT